LIAGLVIGGGLLFASLVLYQTRTHDEKFFTRFWLSKHMLTSREYALNRTGFLISLIVILIAGAHLAIAIYLHR
jgi:hypothetical protein